MKTKQVNGHTIQFAEESSHWVFKVSSGLLKLAKANYQSLNQAAQVAQSI